MKIYAVAIVFLSILEFYTSASHSSRVIIIEDAKACYRKALAGKRILPSLVRKTVLCESLEDCMKECAEENRFGCEGFNYRYESPNHERGECELLDYPLQEINLRRDIINDPNYDYYERDRNFGPDCRPYLTENPYHSYGERRIKPRPYKPPYDDGGGLDFNTRNGFRSRFFGQEHRKIYGESDYGNTDYGDEGYRYERPYGDRRKDKSFNFYHHYDYDDRNYNYSDDHKFNYNGRFFPHTTRVPTYPPEGDVGASRTIPPSPTPSTTYLPSENPTTTGTTTPTSVSPPYRPNDSGFHHSRDELLPPPPPQLYHKRPRPYLPADRRSYLPRGRPDYDFKSYEPFLPPRRDFYDQKDVFWDTYYREREHDWKYWGFNEKGRSSYGNFGKPYGYFAPTGFKPSTWNYEISDKHFQPFSPSVGTKPWSTPGGFYGYGGYKTDYKDSYNYWGFSKHGHSLPQPYPSRGHSFNFRPGDGSSLFTDSSLLKKACSLKMTSGFKLHRHIIKKYVAAKDIHECELICFKERTFSCSSYAYRYTFDPSVPPENCYLSDKDYKNIDYYVDLEPDRNFDVYTMNNREICSKIVAHSRGYSECFWRVRSGLRFDHKIVRESLTCQTLPECQLECLNSRRFTCRSFSYRFGSTLPGGSIDNCQLTDLPFHELNPIFDLHPEEGFEIYERGSFGLGCEPFHFKVDSFDRNVTISDKNELCYVGYGSPAKILPIATKSSVRVKDDLECRQKCTEARENNLFECMSYSFSLNVPPNSPNCDLSDIYQSDLLPNIDYVFDKDSLLYAWNDYDPECIAIINSKTTFSSQNENGISGFSHGAPYPLDTWRLFSVNGWPCKSISKQNVEAGFWFCEIEGASPNSWDYCCRPDHQCGYSEGFSYQWCYVGPQQTQWRKCSDKYYPYARKIIVRLPPRKPEPYLPDLKPLYTNLISNSQPPYSTGYRPYRPPAHKKLPPYKSLDEYEKDFDRNFVEKPMKELGEGKHWPVSYLHKEVPPNEQKMSDNTTKIQEMDNMKTDEQTLNVKYEALSNLIDVIRKELESSKNQTDSQGVILTTEGTMSVINSTEIFENTTSMIEVKPLQALTLNQRSSRDLRKPHSRSYITKRNKPKPTNT